ncbi:MAG: TldD/PmbA family protein [Hyphomicrobiales bacterium]
MSDLQDIAQKLLDLARARGATAAMASVSDGRDTSITVRNGEVEHLEQAEAREAGLRVFFGQSSASISGSVLTPSGLEKLVDQAVAMARLAPPDPFAGLAEPAQLAKVFPALDVHSNELVNADDLRERALAAEASALAVKGVSKSNGAGASSFEGRSATLATNGYARLSARTSFGTSASVIAGEGTAMERDYDGHGAVYWSDVEPAEKIGRTAGERAVQRLNPRKLSSQRVPVIFDRRIATSLIGHLLSGINGAAIARGTSFLKNDMGQALFGSGVFIIDDPLKPRGLASRAVDGEGLPVSRQALIDKGVLTTWLLDLRSARQLNLPPTGHGGRGGPSSSNVHMEAGNRSPAEMMRECGTGLLVTEFIGSSINMVTGDYSRGASGYWFENGAIAYPVSGVTVAGNLRDMFKALEPANDLIFRSSTVAPSCFLGEMTLAGR